MPCVLMPAQMRACLRTVMPQCRQKQFKNIKTKQAIKPFKRKFARLAHRVYYARHDGLRKRKSNGSPEME